MNEFDLRPTSPPPSPPPIPKPPGTPQYCRKCGMALDSTDQFCRTCGAKTRQAGEASGWAYTPIGIIVLTLTVLGPLSLGLVWRSKVMDQRTKWIFAVGIGLFSVVVLWSSWSITVHFFQWWADLKRQMNDPSGF